jgi:hypothetical protein
MANYPNQPYPPQPVVPNSSMAIVSLVMGILGWTILPTLGSIVAIITGHMAKNEIRKSNGTLGGDGMATAGLILGYVNLAVFLCVCLFFVLLPLLGFGLSMPFLQSSY